MKQALGPILWKPGAVCLGRGRRCVCIQLSCQCLCYSQKTEDEQNTLLLGGVVDKLGQMLMMTETPVPGSGRDRLFMKDGFIYY